MDAVPGLVKQINAGVDALGTGGDEARHALLVKARNLMQALETPRETMIKHCWAQADANGEYQTGAMAGLTTGVDTGLWALMAKNGDKPQKVSELASSLKMDTLLLSRLMRHLGAMGYIIETGEDEYRPTNFTNSLSIPVISGGYYAMLAASAGVISFHEFARKTGWQNPTDAGRTSFHQAYQIGKNFFEYLQTVGYGTHFNDHMGGYRQGRLPWMHPSFYPVQANLIDGADTAADAPFLVDIGGSVGHDLAEFQRYFPVQPGKLILQDLPVVIGQITDLDSSIVRMEHDFLTEQPVKAELTFPRETTGARAYYMHSVLHDWPDSVCQKILAPLTAAMRPGYSRLLINENVIPPTGAYWETTALDMIMLTEFSSRERTLDDWQNLVGAAGLRIAKIWPGGKGVESLIECELA
ncbi:O-methyltransferase- family 2 [Apiospora phragmitis]|uniref:O-methyltransferase- family 2 n=1 Tax=Apiospora phragmitis TaxID=2905665 RepID=A0ABR1WVI6_9PEZI